MKIKSKKDLGKAINLVVKLLPLDLEQRNIKLEDIIIGENSMKIILNVKESGFLPEILLEDNLDDELEKIKRDKLAELKYNKLLDNVMDLSLIDLEMVGFLVYLKLVE